MLSAIAAGLLFFSCGLDVVYILEPPTGQEGLEPTDPATRYLRFYTNCSTNRGNSDLSDVFRGVAVYYRLYNYRQDMLSDINSINAYNSEYSDSGANRMISLGYVPLQIDPYADPIINKETDDQISIRFFDEGKSSSAYKAGIYKGAPDNNISGPNYLGAPLRYSKGEGFNFFDSNGAPDEDRIPKDGDEDTEFNSAGGRNLWYLAAFAVSVGRDSSYVNYYSELFHMGYITIQPDSASS